jgi:predicted ATP-dependent endonuclease of OLD family
VSSTAEPEPKSQTADVTDEQLEALFDAEEFGEEVIEDATPGVFARLAEAASYDTSAPMVLSRVGLKNILGFEEADVFPSRFTVLVGANNSGKSSLMRVIAFAQTLLRAHVERVEDDEVILARGRNLDDSVLPVPEVRDLWHRSVRRVGNEWVMAQVELEFSDGVVLHFGLKGPFGHATSRLMTNNRSIPREFYDRLLSFPIVYVPSSVGVVDREEYRTPARIGSLIAGGRAHEILRNLLLDLKDQDRLSAVEEVLEQYFSGSIENVAFDLTSDQYIHVTYKEDASHDLFSAGAGFLQVLQLLTFVVHEQPGILLVDEPDAHLHSSLQRLVVDVLHRLSEETGMQVLVATHSKEIINYVDPDELLVVDRNERELRGLGQHESAIAVLESLGSVDSVDAYQVITTQRVLLVEGSSDVKVLRALAAKKDTRVFEGPNRLVIIETGGEATPQARSDLGILEKMMGQPVESLHILDRDARLDGQVAQVEARAPRPVHVWRRDSIESYLVVPSAIARLVRAKREDIDENDVRAAIEKHVDDEVIQLKDETFDRVSTRYRHEVIRLEERNVEIVEANRVAREALDDPDMLVRLTRGKDLLAATRKFVQDTYGVSFGNHALVAELEEGEADPELWEILDRIKGLAGLQ